MEVDGIREKRPMPPDDTSSSEDEFGSALPVADVKPKKRRKELKHTTLYLQNLPSYDRYTRSYAHHTLVTASCMQPHDMGMLVTASHDGVVKFWQKSKNEGDFDLAKTFDAAHNDRVVGLAFSPDGLYLASIAVDQTLKVYDVKNVDMLGVLKLGMEPATVCWAQPKGKHDENAVVVGTDSGSFMVYDPFNPTDPRELKIHKKRVSIAEYNSRYDCVVSSDEVGMIEYWNPETGQKPSTVFEFKSKTDLLDFRKEKTRVLSIVMSPNEASFAIMANNGTIAVFDFVTGKKLKQFSESIETSQEMQQGGTGAWQPDDVEFGRRLGVERDLTQHCEPQRPQFDRTGNFLIYPALLGIKLVNLSTNACELVLGKEEKIRFCQLSVYQGNPKRRDMLSLSVETVASENKLVHESLEKDPVIVATGFKKNRVYVFSRFDGEFNQIKPDRDVTDNTKIDRQLRTETVKEPSKKHLATKIILHTTLGDVHVKLFPKHAPLAVENFTTHCLNGYYDNIIFHRIIRGFMVQTGDPNGDGTGGESIWKDGKHPGYFKDEFSPVLRHDVPYSLSMANRGASTNGSQFFITTAKTPWLDDKHTLFGRVFQGQDVVTQIEALPTDKSDRPHDPPAIVSTTIVE